MITENGKTIRMRRAFNVGVERLFEAWSDSKLFTTWWKDLSLADMDFRVGGGYRMEWTSDPTEGTFGKFLEIEKNKKIVFSWSPVKPKAGNYNSIITLNFMAEGPNRSHFELVHE